MSSSSSNWRSWNPIKLRAISMRDFEKSEELHRLWFELIEPSNTRQWQAHRLALLMWINEIELAQKFWNENKHHFWGESLVDTLFRLVIVEGLGSGFIHPEFARIVQYRFLTQESAFQLSTIPLSDLLEMDQPHFSSVDGVIDVRFEKNELQRMAALIPQEYHNKLRLPLILLRQSIAGFSAAYNTVGSSLENLLLQRLLKLSSTSFSRHQETACTSEIKSLSMLARRKFKTVYTIFPESTSVFLTVTYKHPELM